MLGDFKKFSFEIFGEDVCTACELTNQEQYYSADINFLEIKYVGESREGPQYYAPSTGLKITIEVDSDVSERSLANDLYKILSNTDINTIHCENEDDSADGRVPSYQVQREELIQALSRQ